MISNYKHGRDRKQTTYTNHIISIFFKYHNRTIFAKTVFIYNLLFFSKVSKKDYKYFTVTCALEKGSRKIKENEQIAVPILHKTKNYIIKVVYK